MSFIRFPVSISTMPPCFCLAVMHRYHDLISRRGGKLIPMTYPTEFKIKAIRRYENRESIKALYQELDISQSTLYHRRKQCRTIQTATHSYTPAEFDAIAKRLKKRNTRLRLFSYWVLFPECRSRKSCRCWSICITRWVISIASKSYVRHWR